MEHGIFSRHLTWLRECDAEMRTLVEEWANIPSGTDNLEGLALMADRLKAAFAGLPGALGEIALEPVDVWGSEGAREKRTVGKILKMVCRGRAPIRVLLSGHYDTVYGRGHSFRECRMTGEKVLNGPGVADMKGGLVVMLYALKALEQSPLKEQLGWEVILSPDEEIGSIGSTPVLKDAAAQSQIGLVFEPALTSGNWVRSRKGSGYYTAVARGRAAHVGRDFARGRNAIGHLSRFIVAFQELSTEFPNVILNPGRISGGGPLNVVPDQAVAHFNIRTSTSEENEAVSKRIRELIEAGNKNSEFQLDWHEDFSRPPKEVTLETEELFKSYQECARELGFEIDWEDTGGSSDGNILAAAGLTHMDGLGPRGGHLHSPQEFIELDSLVERASITALFLMKLAAGEVSFTG